MTISLLKKTRQVRMCSWGSFSFFLHNIMVQKTPKPSSHSARAGHFRYFYIFSIIENHNFAFFMKIITLTYFCTSPI